MKKKIEITDMSHTVTHHLGTANRDREEGGKNAILFFNLLLLFTLPAMGMDSSEESLLSGVVDEGAVRLPGLPRGGNGVVGDEHPAGVGGEPEREGRPQRLAGVGVVAPQRAPVLHHRRPGAAPGLHQVDGAEVAVAVLELHQHLQVERVGALVHPERDVHAAVLARHPATTRHGN